MSDGFSFRCVDGCCLVKIQPYTSPKFKYKKGKIQKAGIVFYDPKEKSVLLVQSRGRLWGPPKGTFEAEKDDDILECALREAYEETGIIVEKNEVQTAVHVKDRAVYFYVEKPQNKVYVQTESHGATPNDANGITWIKIECLKKCISEGLISVNQHCKILMRKIFQVTLPDCDFIPVKPRRHYRLAAKNT